MEYAKTKLLVSGHLRLQILKTVAMMKASIINNMLRFAILNACMTKLMRINLFSEMLIIFLNRLELT